jgi:hypothetical protein
MATKAAVEAGAVTHGALQRMGVRSDSGETSQRDREKRGLAGDGEVTDDERQASVEHIGGVRSFRIWCIGGFSDCLGNHPIGGQHWADEQQRRNHLPGKLGGGERDAEESRQYHRDEPKNGVPLQEVFLVGVFHRLRFGCL